MPSPTGTVRAPSPPSEQTGALVFTPSEPSVLVHVSAHVSCGSSGGSGGGGDGGGRGGGWGKGGSLAAP
ncbi:MAG: hypothetical protein CMI16_13200 [Opitutaceae bacterium]|nr:hypothetical protein [Opitutaceae bacterium]